MSLSEFQIAECLQEIGRFIEKRRPPEHIREQVDLRGELVKSEVILSEVRAPWDGIGGKIVAPFAKVKWIGSRKQWEIYWQRANMKWNKYKPSRSIGSLGDALAEIDADPFGCFFG